MVSTSERAARNDAQALARTYDFRRPDRFGREQVRGLEVLHELFARRFSSGMGGVLRALVSLEPLALDQLSFDDYVRSMPNPTIVGIISVPPLPGTVTLELDVPLALVLVDRMLGGRPGVGAARELRRPTELETFLLRDLFTHAVAALGEALSQTGEATPSLSGLEYNPQFVQVAAPSETVMLLSYRMTISADHTSEGLVTLCYPQAVLGPLLERVVAIGPGNDQPVIADVDREAVRDRLHDVDVSLAVRLRDCLIPARDLAVLRVGDVLRLDHRVDEPAFVEVGGVEVLTAHLGRRGRRMAIRVEGWRSSDDDAPVAGAWENP